MRTLTTTIYPDITKEPIAQRIWRSDGIVDRFLAVLRWRLDNAKRPCCGTTGSALKRLMAIYETILRDGYDIGVQDPIRATVSPENAFTITEGNRRTAVLSFLRRPIPVIVDIYEEQEQWPENN